MTQIIDDATLTIIGKRFDANRLRIACPFCRSAKGAIRFHEHGTGDRPGPWHRLAHCADQDLPPELLKQRRNGRMLSYTIVEEHTIEAPPLVPNAPARIDASTEDRYER